MNDIAKKQLGKNTPLLGKDTNNALRELVRFTRKLVDFAEQEMQALITNDKMSFALMQQNKECLAERYALASEEFRTRLEEFRNADKSILMQLDKAQQELKEKTMSNNMMIDQVKTRARANTQSTLFSVQEMGQRISFPEDNTQNQTEGRA